MSPELRRHIYLWVGSFSLILCLLFSIFGWANAWETMLVFPTLSVYLAVVIALLLYSPASVVFVERSGFWVVAVVWLVGMAVGLARIVDDERAWQSLSPGVFMNMALLVVLAHLWYETHWALAASLVAPVASAAIGMVRFWDSPEYLGRLFQYEGYVVVIVAFTYLLSRGRDTLLTSQVEAERMRLLAFEDALTGLPNRRSVADRLRRLLAADPTAQALSVISFDLDDFKLINDRYGHDAGDRLLRAVGSVARSQLPSSAMLGRWGGEEFLVLLPGFDIDGALLIAEELRLALAAHRDNDIRVTASFGVIDVTTGSSVDDVLRSVDELLYRAKRAGRNTVKSAMVNGAPLIDRRFLPLTPSATSATHEVADAPM